MASAESGVRVVTLRGTTAETKSGRGIDLSCSDAIVIYIQTS